MPSWGSFRRKKRQKRARRHKSALQMPSKNRSDKGDSTMKATVNPRKEKSRNPSNFGGFGMVPVVGLEPTRCRQQRMLSPPRLPIPTHRQEFSSKITTPEIGGHFGGQTSKIKDIQFSKAQINRAVPASEREMTHWILSPSRLPIPSFRRKLYSIIIQRAMQHKLRTQTPHGSAAYAPPQRHE